MGRFNDYLLTIKPSKPALPMTHTCDGFSFRGIIERSQLLANPCPRFHELLVYLFYGRPAYRPGSWQDSSARTVYPYLPCSILLKEASVLSAKRIAPFDTGAYFKGIYNDFFHPGMKFEDFLLDRSRPVEMAQCVAEMFYESNRDYYFDNPGDVAIPPTAFEAQVYYDIIRARATPKHDDRCSTVEIQTDHSILLGDNSVLHVVLPKIFLQDKTFRETIRSQWKAGWSTYEVHQGDLPELMGKVYDCVERYLRRSRLI